MPDLLIELSIAACLFGIFACLVSEEIHKMVPKGFALLPTGKGKQVEVVIGARERLGVVDPIKGGFCLRTLDGRQFTATSIDGAVDMAKRGGC